MSHFPNLRALINPSGGLAYHYTAFRYRRFSWSPYVGEIQSWLESWPQRDGQILLIGPSGGYTLATDFLTQFSQIDAIDPDLWAAKVFQKRHPLKNLTWHFRDDFGTLSKDWNPEGLSHLLNDFPDHQILFCNFLGQLPYLFPQLTTRETWNAWKTQLESCLKGRKWASYHDLYSFKAKARAIDTDLLKKWERDQEGDPQYYLGKLLSPVSRGPLSVYDHCTQGLFPRGRRRLFLWQHQPNRLHIIEARRN